jgi:hypothetical protein
VNAAFLLLRGRKRLQREFPKARIRLRADAGFALPLLYEFCESFSIQYAIGIAIQQASLSPVLIG